MTDSTLDPARRRRNKRINVAWAKRMEQCNLGRRPKGHVRNVKRGPTRRPGHTY